jgi:hypothetical protein
VSTERMSSAPEEGHSGEFRLASQASLDALLRGMRARAMTRVESTGDLYGHLVPQGDDSMVGLEVCIYDEPEQILALQHVATIRVTELGKHALQTTMYYIHQSVRDGSLSIGSNSVLTDERAIYLTHSLMTAGTQTDDIGEGTS